MFFCNSYNIYKRHSKCLFRVYLLVEETEYIHTSCGKSIEENIKGDEVVTRGGKTQKKGWSDGFCFRKKQLSRGRRMSKSSEESEDMWNAMTKEKRGNFLVYELKEGEQRGKRTRCPLKGPCGKNLGFILRSKGKGK